jgi:hypothetical protein
MREIDVDTRSQLNAKSQVVRGTLYLAAMLVACLTFAAITGTVLENLHTRPSVASL